MRCRQPRRRRKESGEYRAAPSRARVTRTHTVRPHAGAEAPPRDPREDQCRLDVAPRWARHSDSVSKTLKSRLCNASWEVPGNGCVRDLRK